MTAPPSALSHVSLGTNRFGEAAAFYDTVLATLGIGRVHDLSEHQAIAYGRAFPEFWIQRPHDGQPAQTANGVHVAFLAESNAQQVSKVRRILDEELAGVWADQKAAKEALDNAVMRARNGN